MFVILCASEFFGWAGRQDLRKVGNTDFLPAVPVEERKDDAIAGGTKMSYS
jgi:hypothetical protein